MLVSRPLPWMHPQRVAGLSVPLFSAFIVLANEPTIVSQPSAVIVSATPDTRNADERVGQLPNPFAACIPHIGRDPAAISTSPPPPG